MTDWKNIRDFSNWWWACPVIFPPLEDYIKHVHNRLLEIVLFRSSDKYFQVELVGLFAHVDVPKHTHPNVDTREYHLFGSGEAIIGDRTIPENVDMTAPMVKRYTTILSGVPHWGSADTDTFVLSLQHWKNNKEASFLTNDWEGTEF